MFLFVYNFMYKGLKLRLGNTLKTFFMIDSAILKNDVSTKR